jgi:hypothetical protein
VPRATSILPLLVLLAVAGSRISFVDASRQAGLVRPIVFGGERDQKFLLESTGTGVAAFDYDNDGRPDLFFVNGTRFENAPAAGNLLYRNLGNHRFEDVTRGSGLTGGGWGQAVCIGDVDNDGRTDLYVTYYGFNRLYRNHGDGTFSDVARQAGVAGERPRWGGGCAFLDYDRDGLLDLFVASYVAYEDAAPQSGVKAVPCLFKGVEVMCGPTGLGRDENILYHNEGNGRFKEVTRAARIAPADGHYSLQPVTADFDEDGWPDIYVGCDATPNILYRNNGDGTFKDLAFASGAAVNQDGVAQATMGVDIADYDGDGAVDIFVTNFSDDTPTLYRNLGNWQFEDVTARAGLAGYRQYVGWGALFLDLDLDGWEDLFLVNGHIYPQVDRVPLGLSYRQNRQVYRNRGNGAFDDLTATAGAAVTRKAAGRGSAAEDFDGDGLLEVVVANMNETPSYLRQDRVNSANWVAISLAAVRSNRSAIGARVHLQAGRRLQKGEVRSSAGYYSSSGLRLHFGLGSASKIEEIKVFWPSGRESVLRDVVANRIVEIREPER